MSGSNQDIFIDEQIIGYFNVGRDIFITRVITVDGKNDSVLGLIRFYLDKDILFEMDVSDALMMAHVLKEGAEGTYQDVVRGAVRIAQERIIGEKIEPDNSELI